MPSACEPADDRRNLARPPEKLALEGYRRRRIAALGSALAVAAACPATSEARAADGPKPAEIADAYPYVEGTANIRLFNDWLFRSTDPANAFDNLYLHGGTLGVKVGLTPVFSVNLGWTLEQVRDPSPPENCIFCGAGLYMDTLDVEADVGRWTFTAGKHEPKFGFAWDIAPGIYTGRFAEDYQLAEVIGAGAAYEFDAAFGKHTLAVDTFFADTTFLSESLFTNRGRRRLSDGGAGNTGAFDNVAVTLFGEDIRGMKGFRYNVGYRHVSAGRGDYGDENGVVAGLARETEIGNGVTLGLMAELAYFDNYGGADDDALYTTAGLKLARGPWHGELGGEWRRFRVADDDRLLQASVGYTFERGYDLSLAYARERAGGANDILGVKLTKCFSFSSRAKKTEC